MQYSIVTYKKVLQSNSDLRIDGEYFKPAYLTSENLIDNIKSTALGNLAEVKGGKRLPLGETFSEEGIPYIRAEDIRLFTDFAESPKISLELHKKLKNYQTKYNDVLLTIVGNSIGDVGIVKFKLDKCNLTENCAKITNLRGLMPEFLFAFLLSRYGQNQIHREKVGTAQPKLALTRMRNFKIALLSESFQSITRNLINKAENAQNKAKQFYHQAEQILLSELGLLSWKPKHQLSFIKSFSDTQSADRIDAEYFQPLYDEIVKVITKIGEAKPIGEYEFIKVTTGQYAEEYCDKTSGLPYIRGTDLLNGTVNMEGLVYIPRETQDKTKLALEGDVVVTRVGTIGLSARIPKECGGGTISDNLIRLRIISDELNSYYLALFLDSILGRSLMIRNSRGSVQQRLNQETLKEIIVPILNKDIQQNLAAKVEEAHKKRGESKLLLEIAKRGVEMAIEKSEEEAQNWINQEVKSYA